MKGYHYTSWGNWERIRKEGLRPQPVHPRWNTRPGTKAVWTWTAPLKGRSEFGQIMWTLLNHDCEKVVRLSYEFDNSQCYGTNEGGIDYISHTLHFSTNNDKEIDYHRNAPSQMLLTTVPPEKITCEAVFEISSTEAI